MNTQEKLRYLQTSRILSPVDDNILVLLAEAMEQETYAGGEIVFSSGEPADEVYILLEGTVEVIDSHSEDVLTELFPGDLFGAYGIITGTRNSTVRAVTQVSVLIMDYVRFRSFLFQYPDIMYQLLEEAVRRLNDDRDTIPIMNEKNSP